MQGGASVVEFLEQRRLLTQIGIDHSFGQDGTEPAGANRLFQQVGNKLLAVSESTFDDSESPDNVHLLTLDGTNDPSFGPGVDISQVNYSSVVALSGKRVLALATDNLNDPHVVAFGLDGKIDKTFGKEGVAAITLPPAPRSGETLYIVSNVGIVGTSDGGAVLAVDYTYNDGAKKSDDTTALIKIDANGAIDKSWGTDGFFTTGTTPSTESREILPPQIVSDGDDRIIVLTGTGLSEGAHPVLERLTPQGKLDTTYGVNGKFDFQSVESEAPYFGFNFALGSDQKLIVSGSIFGDHGDSAQILCLTADGQLDKTFGDSGISSVPNSGDIESMRVDSQGRILFTDAASPSVLTRLNASGQLDKTFNDSGTFALGELSGTSVELDSSDQIYLTNVDSITRLAEVSPATLAQNGTLFVTGTEGNDQIGITEKSGQIRCTVNDQTFKFDATAVNQIFIDDISGDTSGDDNISSSIDVNTTVSAGDGQDTIITAGGDDRIMCGTGFDSVNAGAGNDYVHGSTGSYAIEGGPGNDRIDASGATIAGISGGDGNDSIYGSAGNDALSGGAGKDIIHAGPGNDLVSGNGGRDHLFGQQGKDRLYGGNGDDILDAGSGNDHLTGGPGSDYLAAGPGDDTLTANDGVKDSVYGGDGNDSATIDAGIDLLRSIETN